MGNCICFEHKIDKSAIPVCNIMGVNVAAINMEWLLNFTCRNIQTLSGDYMCVANVHTLVTSFEDKSYCTIQNGGIMAIPDGGPLSSIGKKRGCEGMKRTTGPDYMKEILKISVAKGYRHYFYGSTDETLNKLYQNLKCDYPGLAITGMYSPPFQPMTENEDETVIQKINASDSDFVWVGLGAPKQERWMAAHQGKIKGFMVGVGAGFDYLAGNINRAPIWMQQANLEWIFRLMQEPRRLFFRYWHTNTKFIWHAYIKGE